MIKYLISATITAAALFTPLLLTSCDNKEKEEPVNVLSSLQDVSKLQLAQMTVGKVGTISDPDFLDAKTLQDKALAAIDKIKIGKRLGVYSYDTYISAYIDLSQLTSDDVVVDNDARTVTINLPPVQLEYEGRDLTLKEEHYRVTGLRSNITPEERAQLKEQMGKELKKEVKADPQIEKNLKETARRKAVQYFSILLRDWGYEPDIRY